MVAVPETVGVHWKTRSGEFAELPQLPASELVPLVVPLKVPPCAGMTVGLLQAPASALEDCPAWPWQTATPACPGVALGGDARRDLVAAHLPTLPSERRSVRGSRDVKGREQSQQ